MNTWKAVEEYRTARSEEKRVHKQKKNIIIERGLEELEYLRSTTKTNPSTKN